MSGPTEEIQTPDIRAEAASADARWAALVGPDLPVLALLANSLALLGVHADGYARDPRNSDVIEALGGQLAEPDFKPDVVVTVNLPEAASRILLRGMAGNPTPVVVIGQGWPGHGAEFTPEPIFTQKPVVPAAELLRFIAQAIDSSPN